MHSIVSDLVPVAMTLEEIREETAKDTTLTRLVKYIQTGNRRACKTDSDLRAFFPVFNELSCAEGLVLRGSRIVLPVHLHDRAVKLCHEGHPGIVRTNQLLWSKLWFPGLERKVEAEVESCIPCQVSVPLTVHES